MHKIENIFSDKLLENANVFLKIDVQGYEDNILKGAKEILPKIKGIQLECSLIKMHEGEILLEEIIRKIKSMGF